MSKFFKNIKVGVIEEVEDKDVIDMMTRHTETYVEVDNPAKKPAEKAEKKAEKAEKNWSEYDGTNAERKDNRVR